jgi:hypothetical protein
MALTTYTAGEVLTAASLNDNFTFAAANPTSKIVQVVSTTLTTTFTTSSTSFTDITGLTVSITPTLNTSKILVIASVSGSNDIAVVNGAIRLARGGTGIFVGDTAGSRTSGQGFEALGAQAQTTLGLTFLDSPATTSATTYSVQIMNTSAGTAYINRGKNDTNANNNYRSASSITVMEILA